MGVEHEQPGVAVGWRFHHQAGADAAGSARLIFDDQGCVESLLQAGLDHARDGIGRATRWKWHDDLDDAGRPGLRLRGNLRSYRCGDAAKYERSSCEFHGYPPRNFIITASIQLLRALRMASLADPEEAAMIVVVGVKRAMRRR